MQDTVTSRKNRVQRVLEEIGYPSFEAEEIAEDFITKHRREIADRDKPDVKVRINSLDKRAGEIIITVYETSERAPDNILESVLERRDKDPEDWAVKRKLKETGSDGQTSYVAKPIRQKSSSSSSSKSSSKDLADEAEDMDPEEAEKLLNELLTDNG